MDPDASPTAWQATDTDVTPARSHTPDADAGEAHPGPAAAAVFPAARPERGMYESFYLRAVDPRRPRGVWIRYTVHKPPGEPPRGSLWLTYFDLARPAPFTEKLTTTELSVPVGGWIAVGPDTAVELGGVVGPDTTVGLGAAIGPGTAVEPGTVFGPGGAHGACGGARWALELDAQAPPLWHLPRPWMYRAPLPRTKLTSPAPAARFTGTLVVPGQDTAAVLPAGTAAAPRDTTAHRDGTAARATAASEAHTPPAEVVELDGWPGMVGHNWGAEHAERWIWLHGIAFAERPDAWLDLAIGRVRVAGRTTPWVANGAIALGGRRHRLGGLAARGLLVAEAPGHCRLTVPGPGGIVVQAHVHSPPGAIAGWRYADPDGGGHEVANCSIAGLDLTIHRQGEAAQTLRTDHGAAYELGMRGSGHGIALAPFGDG